jgi:hypothetical protein
MMIFCVVTFLAGGVQVKVAAVLPVTLAEADAVGVTVYEDFSSGHEVPDEGWTVTEAPWALFMIHVNVSPGERTTRGLKTDVAA